jgi:FPC/CPF motif-containing protein YcgG
MFIFYLGHDAIDWLIKDRMYSAQIPWLGKTAKIFCRYIGSPLFHIGRLSWRSALRICCFCSRSVIFHPHKLFNPGNEVSHTFSRSSRDYVLVRIPGLNLP